MTRYPQVTAIDRLARTLGNRGHEFSVVYIAVELVDYFPTPLGLDCFRIGASDYDIVGDELYCPCGETLRWESGVIGDAVDIAGEHMEDAHPGARR